MEVPSQVITTIGASVTTTLIKQIFNVKHGEFTPGVLRLQAGDRLCRGRIIPMSPGHIRRVTQIYKEYESLMGQHDTPLMKALAMGYMDIVWGFIECAKQTNSNLLTGETGDDAVKEFLWLENKKNQRTSFDVAIDKNRVEMAMLLWNNAPLRCVASQFYSRGKALHSMLNNDPKLDALIFETLKKVKEGEMNLVTSSQIVNFRQESIINTESIDYQPQKNETLEYLKNLDHDLLELNPIKNTILHLASKYGDVKYVKDILEQHPSMISCCNSNGETPAYVAAREGRVDVLQVMLTYLKKEKENHEIERIVTRMDKHNALHVAIQNHHVEIIFLLIEEIPQLVDCTNDSNENALYLAVERRYFEVLKLIFKKSKHINVKGPNGKTALHAAVISDSTDCIEYLLNESRDLLGVKDDNGWTAFQYAIHHNNLLATTKLLNIDHSIGYQLMTEDDIDTTAIHIASSRGYYEIMKVLIFKCPPCIEFIDNKERNILHVAVENKQNKVIEFIFQDQSLTSLVNQKDINGNTPIHLLVASDFEMIEKVIDSRVDINVLNNRKETPLDKTSSHDQRKRLIKCIATGNSIHKEDIPTGRGMEMEALYKVAESLVIVATLIATTSFAAGITVPGGLHSEGSYEQAGTPFLLRKSAFMAFAVTNAFAFCFSCSVLVVYVYSLLKPKVNNEASLSEEDFEECLNQMYFFTSISLIALAIAFVTGVYVVLIPNRALAISICAISVLILFSRFL